MTMFRPAALALIGSAFAVALAATPALAQRHADLVYLQQAKAKAQATTAAAKAKQEQAQQTPAQQTPGKPAPTQTSGK
jgi:hypothetical protein